MEAIDNSLMQASVGIIVLTYKLLYYVYYSGVVF